MATSLIKKNIWKSLILPISVNNEDWWYWWECLVFPWCFSDWNNLDEYSKNMWNAIYSYMEAIDDWFFDVSNISLLKINIDKNGQVNSNIVKKIDRNSYKALSCS